MRADSAGTGMQDGGYPLTIGRMPPQFEHMGAGMTCQHGSVVEQGLHDSLEAEAHLV